MKRRTYGQMDLCHLCGQDIQWLGTKGGWRDRGNNRGCVPYKKDGEFVTPPKTAKHKPASEVKNAT